MSLAPPTSKLHLRTPPEPGKKSAQTTYLIYFITGNPGLIEYYRTFLTHLYGVLSQNTASDRSIEFQVYGRSLSGFEVNSSEIKTYKYRRDPPYGLQDQIRHAEDDVVELVEDLKDNGAKDVRVILVGHSVGAYISLEIVRRLRAHGVVGEDFDTRISGVVGLFPTVVDLARSESGMKAAPFVKNSNFVVFLSVIAGFISMLLPLSLLTKLIASVMSFPQDAAHTTASFVKSPHGVLQALHMARDEMFQIDTDIWDEDIWGAAADAPVSKHPHPRPTLRFLFAKKDHWVADETRDQLIRTRGRFSYGDEVEVEGPESWKPVMEVDETEGWVHSFCVRHGVPVAERVAGYVRGIVERDLKR
ncbi:hypothetical protein HBI25_069880 [Parastagonospora nodorum]|nr:hypothetical protein HBH51_026270 [Parastagonospora nodorum]KAH4000780.1 hypothetical protein HBI10_099050 [Parastagonospora nodorum]KAH4026773.1 hypothetical protein HBI13_066550 [Parastagonospora nodorum]KAH4051755.1 hypothetical protein HBH49_107570 [Parastagonospora nodorum]KAH4127150.1 hypothetical protein HBH47_045890 [Parastagonospora nodorum]